MKYTAIFIDVSKKGYGVETYVSHPDKNRAWSQITKNAPSHKKLMFLILGDQIVYAEDDISLTFGS